MAAATSRPHLVACALADPVATGYAVACSPRLAQGDLAPIIGQICRTCAGIDRSRDVRVPRRYVRPETALFFTTTAGGRNNAEPWPTGACGLGFNRLKRRQTCTLPYPPRQDRIGLDGPGRSSSA